MTTMLEKAAREVFDTWVRLSGVPEYGAEPYWLAYKDKYAELARAALEAIREPTIPVAAAGQWHWLAKIMGFNSPAPPVIDCVEANRKARENFTVMIDAILNEKKT